MRCSLHVLALVPVLLGVLATGARAEDDWRPPVFSVAEVAPTDGERPEGWRPAVEAGVVPDEAPSVKTFLELADAAGVEARLVSARVRPLRKGEGPVGVQEGIKVFGNDLATMCVGLHLPSTLLVFCLAHRAA